MLIPKALNSSLCNELRPILRKAGNKQGDYRPKITGGIVGYFEKPTCRVTAFNRDHLEEWGELLRFIREVNRVFRKQFPKRYIPQRVATYESNQDWVIEGTAFSTMTVNLWDENHKARTVVHKDEGDFARGFGVISIVRSGNYSGGELIFPEYRVAVDLHTGDVLLCDVHEWHCNNEITPISPGWERIATISYFRTKIRNCPK